MPPSSTLRRCMDEEDAADPIAPTPVPVALPHPLEVHALRRLLPQWSLRPVDGQHPLLTLALAALFATEEQKARLEEMRTWSVARVQDYFTGQPELTAAILAEDRPLEAVHLILQSFAPSPIPAR